MAAATPSPNTPSPSGSSSGSPYRLPTHTTPNRYDVELTPDLDAATFVGTVTIEVQTHNVTDAIELNAAELTISTATIDDDEVEVEPDPAFDRLRLVRRDGQPFHPGPHSITLSFAGVLNDQLRGWYRSTFRDDDGHEQVIATSQMQSTDCRRAFPCWDEPAFKAVFGITLIVDDHLLAISNGREIDRAALEDHKVRVRFADTMKMSSYLVAMVVGPLTATDWVDVDGVPLRIVCVPGKEHLTEFGLEIGAFALRWFQDYYGIEYPADKVELVALPDFAAGAMENLGCITFRESLLLVDPDTATQAEKQLVADVVAHELAHMWFGDLVTMEWWNGIWLNEAFATFMELAASDAFRPEWERWNSFALERSSAFETDSLESTRPIEFHVESPDDADAMFDVLTYLKGGALLRMLEQHLGPEEFRRGVSAYLAQHAHGNTETSDLWDAIEAKTGQPVRSMMDSWIWQPGYPLVSAELTNDQTLALSQRRFRFGDETSGNGTTTGPATTGTATTGPATTGPGPIDASVWSIPLEIRHGDQIEHLVLDRPTTTVALTGSAEQPVVVNARGQGFLRVAYTDDLLSRFDAGALSSLSTLERYNLVDDAWNAVVAGAATAPSFVALVQRFGAERSLDVWQRIGGSLATMERWLVDEADALTRFRSFTTELVRPAWLELGEPTSDDTDLDRSLRGYLLKLLAVTGRDAEAITRADRYYGAWQDDPDGVDAELAAAATTVLATFGDTVRYEAFVDRFKSATVPQVQLRHLNALPRFDSADLMAKTCALALSDDVKSQNGPFVLNGCIANPDHGPVAWEFVKDHWDVANERFPRNAIVRMISSVALLDRAEFVSDAQTFFAGHPIDQAAKTLQQILERQQVNQAVRSRETQALAAWLDQ